MARFKRKRFFRRKRFSRYRRGTRRFRRFGRRNFRKSGSTLHVRRAGGVVVVTTSAGLEFDGAFSFTLNDCFGAGEFTGLFDQYRINAVVLKIMPDYSNLTTGDTKVTTVAQPNFHYAVDVNDAQVVNIGVLAEYANYKVTRFNRTITVKLRPRASRAYYQSAVTTAYGPAAPRTWLDTNSANLPHYGFKFVCDNVSLGQVVNFRIRKIYYVSLKSIK